MPNTETLAFLKEHLPFWGHLSPQEAETLAAGTRAAFYRAGENLHSAQNECAGVVLVKSGELRSYILSETGKEVTLYRLGAGALGLVRNPVVGFPRRIAAPAIECIIDQHSGIELFEIVGKHPRQAERQGNQPCGFGHDVRPGSIGTAHDDSQMRQGRQLGQTEATQHHIERAAIAVMAPDNIIAFDIERCRAKAFGDASHFARRHE